MTAHRPPPSAPPPSGEIAQVVAALGDRARLDVPLGPLTTYKVGGPAAVLVEVRDGGDLVAVRAALHGVGVPVLALGRGSNLLVADAGFPGVVVRLGGAFDRLDLPARGSGTPARPGTPGAPGGHRGQAVVVRAGAALALPVLARRTVEAGLTGLAWAVGVPGSVGGALRMNAGGHGADTAGVVRRYGWVDLVAGTEGEDDAVRLAHGYRSSSLAPSELVTWAEFDLLPGDPAAGRAEMAAIVRWRRTHQPGGGNAGSVFANPPGDAAGRLVEAAGCKGVRIGTARVSEKHANFIQADPGGSADDVRRVMDHVQAEVHRICGVELRTEVKLVGFAPERPGGHHQPSTGRSR